jgi:AraC-like DNA-binding protein
MKQQVIFLKGMVCNRCLLSVRNELESLGYTPLDISLGEVNFAGGDVHDSNVLKKRLQNLGFVLMEDKKVAMVTKVKQLIEEVYSGNYDFPTPFRFSELVKQRLHTDYTMASKAFIAAEKITVEQYIIEYRISKVKEFLVYSNFPLSDIAFKFNFNSVAHLSAQFRQQTGLTTSYFKEINKKKLALSFSEN